MTIFDNTWIKLPRDFVEWRWYHNSETVHLFLYLLLNANIKEAEYNNVTINRGELITSIRQLSISTGNSIQTIRTCLKRLKISKEIKYRKLNNQGTIIIMLDFNKYQPVGIDESVTNWIKLYRRMINWEWFFDSKISHLYVHFLLKGKVVHIPTLDKYACQLETSRLQLSRETGISEQSLKTCIKKLTEAKEIMFEQKSTNHRSTVTICKYDDYSVDDTNVNTALTQHQHSINTLSKNIRKKDKKERISSSSACACEEENFEEDFEKGLKENEQKKASKERDEDFSMQLLSNEQWLLAMQTKYKLPSENIQMKLEEFTQDLKCRMKPPHKDLQDFVGHFCDWLAINKCKKISQDIKPQNEKRNGIFKREEELAERQTVTANKDNGDYSSKL